MDISAVLAQKMEKIGLQMFKNGNFEARQAPDHQFYCLFVCCLRVFWPQNQFIFQNSRFNLNDT